MQYDKDEVLTSAAGQWADILLSVTSIDASYLTGDHGPCPKCRTGTDRWRFTDLNDNGGAICNQCGRGLSDGLGVICWFNDWPDKEFPKALKLVADHLGINPSKSKGRSLKRKSSAKSKSRRSPAKKKETRKELKIRFHDWNDQRVGLWCLRKKIDVEALKACGAKVATYGLSEVIAMPAVEDDEGAIGWTLYEVTDGFMRVKEGKKFVSTKVKTIKY